VEPIKIPLASPVKDLELKIEAAFPKQPLHQVGFRFGRVRKGGRQLIDEIKPDSLPDLKAALKQAVLPVMPEQQLPKVCRCKYCFSSSYTRYYRHETFHLKTLDISHT